MISMKKGKIAPPFLIKSESNACLGINTLQ